MITILLNTFTGRFLRRAATLSLAIILSGCAVHSRDADRQRRARPLIMDGLNINAVNDVFVRGFGEINDRAFEEASLDRLFLSALAGLRSIDPDLLVAPVNGQLLVNFRGRPVGNLGDASQGNIADWSLETLRVLLAARKVSPLLHAADEEMIYKAIFTGALSSLDPYSRYASREEAIRNRLVRDGVIGLGVRFEIVDDGALVKTIVEEGPGEIAGLDIGDVITHANGIPLRNLTLTDVRRRLDGIVGTTVTLTFHRPGESGHRVVTAALDLVVPDTVAGTLRDGLLELRILSFNQRTAHAVEKAVKEAKIETGGSLRGIVLDLRGDPGGLLDQAIELADLFLESGTITTLHGRHPGANQYYAAHRGDIAEGAHIAVLIDGKSASAAEIVAAALQDNKRAAIIGTVSWGKGSVQTVRRLPNGGEIALTWARMVTPRGAELHGLGLMPDVCLSGSSSSVSEAIDFVYSDALSGRKARHDWEAPADDPAAHESLRTACPAEPHVDRSVDIEVARRIISDPALLALATLDDAPQLAITP